MKLFTKEIDKKLFEQYPKGSDLDNQMVVAKIFNPYGRGVWYLLNSDPQDTDYIWAIVDLFDVEQGSVSRSELQTIKLPPFGLGLERDLYFDPKPAKEVLKGLMEGKRYSYGGRLPGRYYKDNEGNELRFIGEESNGRLIFKDGEKVVYKTEDDFENGAKEHKIFKFFEDGGEIDWGEDLGGGFNIGTDVQINDPKSLYKGKTGFVNGLVGNDLLVTILENGNERNVVVSKKGAQKLDAPEFAKGGKLIGNQKKLDVNKNGKLDAQDFKMLRGKMAMGGKVKFVDKVKAVKESLLKRKKVSPKVQKDYGKTYSPKEAEQSAKRIIGAQVKKYEVKKK